MLATVHSSNAAAVAITCYRVVRWWHLEQRSHLIVHHAVVLGEALPGMARISTPQLPQVQGVGHLPGAADECHVNEQ